MKNRLPPFALVVDDDPIILMNACDILADAGFRSCEACDGDSARDILESRAEDVTLLFSDVEMPGRLDGFALARLVAEKWPWIEIVIASGRMCPREGDLPRKATFLPKPFSEATLLRHLRDQLPSDTQPEQLARHG